MASRFCVSFLLSELIPAALTPHVLIPAALLVHFVEFVEWPVLGRGAGVVPIVKFRLGVSLDLRRPACELLVFTLTVCSSRTQ